MAVRGIKQVKNNMRKLQAEIQGRRTEAAVYAVLSQGGAAAATMTPVDTGTLINSHFVDIKADGNKVTGRNGYSAEYAAAVHSAPGVLKGQDRPDREGKSQGQYWDPNGEPHFLTAGFDQIAADVPRILRNAYRAFDRRS
ncbi:hypothetical protein EX253_09440 [Alcaligenes faecalis]|nr:hypothetical protein [Providencia rettgeri]MBX7031201.1 hypothetical protein [Alcaligenes faecalis]